MLNQHRTVPAVRGMTTATQTATQVTCQTSPLPCDQRLGPFQALAVPFSQKQDRGYERRIAGEDIARAIEWVIKRGTDQCGNGLFVNVGSNEWNCQVKDLANAVAHTIHVNEIRISP